MRVVVRGRVVSGLGEGSRYVELYSQLFEEILGYKPYPGTLNIELEDCYDIVLKGCSRMVIKPPSPELCEAIGYIGYVKGIKVLLLRPLATRHDCRVLEIIAPTRLRDLLGLKDGDVVEVHVE